MQLSFWDSMIIETAIVSGATLLLSEDLRHDLTVYGIHILNPFISA